MTRIPITVIGKPPEELRVELRLDDKLKRVDISLDDTEGYTISFTLGSPSRCAGTIKLCASTEAFVEVVSGDRIILTITRLGEVLLRMKVEITLNTWNAFSYEGFECYRDGSLGFEEAMLWAR